MLGDDWSKSIEETMRRVLNIYSNEDDTSDQYQDPPTPSIKEFVRIGSTLKCELVQIPTLTEMLKGQIMGDSDQFQATSSKIIQSNFNALPAALLNSTRNSSLQ